MSWKEEVKKQKSKLPNINDKYEKEAIRQLTSNALGDDIYSIRFNDIGFIVRFLENYREEDTDDNYYEIMEIREEIIDSYHKLEMGLINAKKLLLEMGM